MRPKDVDEMPDSVDPYQTAPSAVCSGSAFCIQTYLSQLSTFKIVPSVLLESVIVSNQFSYFTCVVLEYI